MTAAAAEAAPPVAPPGPLDLVLRIVGGVVVTALAAVSALYEAFLTPLYFDRGELLVRLPVALVLAVAGNAALAWSAWWVTGRLGAVLAPAAVWVGLMFAAAGRTREGDYVLTANNWVGMATLFAGSLAFAIVAYWMVLRSLRRRRTLS